MDDAGNEAYVLGPDQGRSIDLGAFRMAVEASGDQWLGTSMIWRRQRGLATWK